MAIDTADPREQIARMEQLNKELEAAGIKGKEVTKMLDRGGSLMTSNKGVVELAKLHWGQKSVPVAEVAMGKNFKISQAFESMGRQLSGNPDLEYKIDPASEFDDENGKKIFGLVVNIESDMERTNETELFAGQVRSWEQRQKSIVTYMPDASEEEIFNRKGLGEIARNVERVYR